MNKKRFTISLIVSLLIFLALVLLKVIGIPEKCYLVDTDIAHCDWVFSSEYWRENPDSWKDIHYFRF